MFAKQGISQSTGTLTFRFNMRAFCRYTHKRFEPTHGDVLNLHTFFFRAPRRTTHHTLRTNTSTNTTDNDTAQHSTPQHQNTKRTSHTHSQHMHHSQHTRTTISTHTHNTRHVHIHTHTPPSHHTYHTPHTRMLGHVHNRQPTVILRRKSECLDMRTAVNRP